MITQMMTHICHLRLQANSSISAELIITDRLLVVWLQWRKWRKRMAARFRS